MQAPALTVTPQGLEEMMKEDMKDARSASQMMQAATAMPIPLNAWLSGFDYVFGYQIKLLQEFWGFSPED